VTTNAYTKRMRLVASRRTMERRVKEICPKCGRKNYRGQIHKDPSGSGWYCKYKDCDYQKWISIYN